MGDIFVIILLLILGICLACFPKEVLAYNPFTKKYNYGKLPEKDVKIRIWLIKISGYMALVGSLAGLIKNLFAK